MAQFVCMHCDHEGHFTEFANGTHADEDGDEVDDLECPECGADSGIVET